MLGEHAALIDGNAAPYVRSHIAENWTTFSRWWCRQLTVEQRSALETGPKYYTVQIPSFETPSGIRLYSYPSKSAYIGDTIGNDGFVTIVLYPDDPSLVPNVPPMTAYC